MFTKDSIVVKLWIKYIKAGKYTITQVPAIGNLKELVETELNV